MQCKESDQVIHAKFRGLQTIHGKDGVDGKDGQDGFSPVVSVSDITGGHRITITDANGTKTVDVMDGKKGDKGDNLFTDQVTGEQYILYVSNGKLMMDKVEV